MASGEGRRQTDLPRILKGILRIVGVLLCLYFFICSLSLLSNSFRLLAGRNTGKVFSQRGVLGNPIVGMILGVLATVLVQSSSTTTSIVVGMVASGVLEVKQAIPMVMGANIGTSVTNTIVSITQIGDRSEFERAFACAVVHDIFNWLCVLVFLPIEVITGYLRHLTGAMVSGLTLDKGEKPPDLLKAITKPLTNAIIQLDKKVLKGWSLNEAKYENVTTLLKANCKRAVDGPPPPLVGEDDHNHDYEKYQCGYLFAGWGISDTWMGLILLAFSLIVLCSCLVLLVKLLNSLMKESMAKAIKEFINADFPYVPWLTGYLAILLGAVVTMVIQSSSVFTSILTPLCGAGLFSLERVYPLTLGSNIGTTGTGLLAALASDPDRLAASLQIALCHLFFNISGILLFYPAPFMRWPIPMARVMGRVVAQYRWVALFYLFFMFFLLPLYVFGLSLIGVVAIYVAFVPLIVLLVAVILINYLQNEHPNILPSWLRDWNFLPFWMRSLEPYDNLVGKLVCCKKYRDDDDDDEGQKVRDHKGDLEMK